MRAKAIKYDSLTSDSSKPLYAPSARFMAGLVGVAEIPGKGLSAIAMMDIKAGTMIERAPVSIMPTSALYPNGNEVELANYSFRWGPEDSNKKTELCAIIKFGMLASANHSATPNTDIRADEKNLVMEWFAVKDIDRGEELCIDYDCELWFDPA